MSEGTSLRIDRGDGSETRELAEDSIKRIAASRGMEEELVRDILNVERRITTNFAVYENDEKLAL